MENEATTETVAEAPEFTVTEIDNTEDIQSEAEVADTEVEAPIAVEGESLSPEVQADEDEEDEYFSPMQFQPQGPDLSSIADEEGNVAPDALQASLANWQQQTMQAAQQAALQQMQEVRYEEKLWSKAFKEYPALENNKELRNLVQQTRVGAVINGKNATPLDAAKSIFKHIEGARSTGQRQANESVKVQQSAALVDTSSVQAARNQSSNSGLNERIKSRNKEEATSARQELFEQWAKDGSLFK